LTPLAVPYHRNDATIAHEVTTPNAIANTTHTDRGKAIVCIPKNVSPSDREEFCPTKIANTKAAIAISPKREFRIRAI
jgi:hypothetical protein